MKEQIINDVLRAMQGTLNNAQLLQLQTVLRQCLGTICIVPDESRSNAEEPGNEQLLL